MHTAPAQTTPEAAITNGILTAKLYLPDPAHGYYQGTRFDWSGVIHSLTYRGHDYYGPWYTKRNPPVHDFIFDGDDIIAGACSAITGPVEEFSTEGKALGYDETKAGDTFIKIGVGVLRKPDNADYDPYRLYEIVDSGKRTVKQTPDSVEFTHELHDPTSGYAYEYTKIVRLIPGKPEMVLEHHLRNIGRKAIHSSVYDHNFLVLDKLPIGPGFEITLPYSIHTRHPFETDHASIDGKKFIYNHPLKGKDTVAVSFLGFGSSPSDYDITVENTAIGAGVRITSDRPVSHQELWSIRSTLSMEPFVDMSIEPGQTFGWKYNYSYFATK